MSDKVIENLITKLSFEYDKKAFVSFKENIATVAKGLTVVVTAAAAASAAIFVFTKSIAGSNDELFKFSQTIDESLDTLQSLGYAAELNGGSLEAMNSALENISKITSEAARGIGAGVEIFGMLGISATSAGGRVKGSSEMLLEVADSISVLNTQAEKLEYLNKLGIDSGLLLTLQQGSTAIKKQQEEARKLGFILDEDAGQSAADFNDELSRTSYIFQGVKSAIATRLMKQITPMMITFKKWFLINKDLIQQKLSYYLEKLVLGISALYKVGVRMFVVIAKIVDSFGGWKAVMISIIALLGILYGGALLVPALIAGAVALTLIALEDLQKWLAGQDSVFGQWVKDFPEVEKVIRKFISLLGEIKENIIDLSKLSFKFIEDLLAGKFLPAITKFFDKFPGLNRLNQDGEIPKKKKKSPTYDIPNDSTVLAGITNLLYPQSTQYKEYRNEYVTQNTNNNAPSSIVFNISGNNIPDMETAITKVLSRQYSSAVDNLAGGAN